MVNPTLHLLVCQYISEQLRLGVFSPATVPAVRWHLRSFLRFAGHHTGPEDITPLIVQAWLAEHELAPATRRHRLSWFRCWCRWLIVHGHMTADPTMNLRMPRQPRPTARGLGVDDIGLVLDHAHDMRLRLIILLMAQEGLRAIEVARAGTSDVDWADRTIWVHGKGGERRLLPISDETWQTLTVYWAGRIVTGPLVRSKQSPARGITAGWVCVQVSRVMRQAGVAGTGHRLRHSMASHVLRSGRGDIRDVQRALGHASLVTTAVYLPESDVRRLRNVMGGRWYGSTSKAS